MCWDERVGLGDEVWKVKGQWREGEVKQLEGVHEAATMGDTVKHCNHNTKHTNLASLEISSLINPTV